MKSLITILAIVLSLGFANAQERGNRVQRSPEEMAKMQTERLTKELNLTETQKDSIEKYVLANPKELHKIYKENAIQSGNREAYIKTMQDLRQKHTQKIKTFLNEEQSKKYDELAKQRGRGFGAGGQRQSNN